MSSQEVSGSNSASEDRGAEVDTATRDMAAEYEQQRLKRIRENKERMEAMGLRNMASSFLRVCDEKKYKRKLKGKAKVDEEYRPSDDDEEEEGSGGSDDEEFVSDRRPKTANKKIPKKKKKVSVQNLMDATEVMDEDEDLKLAIALSLREAENIETAQRVGKVVTKKNEARTSGKGADARNQKDKGNRKTKKQMVSRLQMMEDEVILHFFRFDEAGKGGINLRDLRRMVYAHDFAWTDEEMADMIKYFDSDGDGKLSLDDFHDIADRCGMIRRPENGTQT